MDDSVARSRRRRGAAGGSAEAVVSAPGSNSSFVLDSAFEASFQGESEQRQVAPGGGLWGSGAGGEGKEGESFDDVPRSSSAGQFMTSFSGGSAFGGSNSSLFSGMQLFGASQPQPVVMQQQQQQMASVQRQQQMQNFSTGLGWQNMTSLVGGGGQQSLGQQSQALMHGQLFGSEQGLAPSSSLGHLIPAEENWIGRDGDAIPASEMSLGGDSSDSEDSSKGGGLLRGRKKKLSKGETPGEKLWRKIRGMRIVGPFSWTVCCCGSRSFRVISSIRNVAKAESRPRASFRISHGNLSVLDLPWIEESIEFLVS